MSASKKSNSCSSSGAESSAPGGGSGASGTSLKQSTPFNFSKFGILVIFCIILALSSSTYHNWPAIERSLVNDRVFQNLCTDNEIREAIPEMYVCDKQRDAIGNLSLNIFLFEFIAYSIGGPLVDVVGVYIVMVAGFTFGFFGFILLYFSHDMAFIVKISFCCWGMFGGLIIITAIHFARMFPQAKSLADGMMIFFENLASVIPLVIYRLIKRFGIKYYEGYGGYIIWGIFPSFLLALSFMPVKIMPQKDDKQNNNEGCNNSSTKDRFFQLEFQCLAQKLTCWELWANLVVFSIPVTSAMFYRKTFSAYFLNNPSLQNVFPFVLLFVFLPIPFISALDQFISVHLTSAFLYILYILAFLCFFYRTKAHGLISMVLFCIAHSAEHQIMHYISKYHEQYESTLMGISYSVVFVVGFISQYIFDCIYRFSPKAALYTIISLLLVATISSLTFDIVNKSKIRSESCKNVEGKSSDLTFSSLRVVYVIFWLIPFIFLSIRMVLESDSNLEQAYDNVIKPKELVNYNTQKVVTTTMVFYSFSFYYVCNVFTVVATIFRVCKSPTFEYDRHRFIWLLIFLTSFFIVPHVMTSFHFYFGQQTYEPIFKLLFVLFICKILLFIQSMMKHVNTIIYLFSAFLVLYGYTFFLFIHMLAYYNFQITYVERSYYGSLIHWGGMFTLFLLFRVFYLKISKYRFGYYTLWAFSTGYFAFFGIQLIYYFPYEMDFVLRFSTCNLPVPRFTNFKINGLTDPKPFCTSLFGVAILISNFAILISFKFCWTFLVVFFWCGFNGIVASICSFMANEYFEGFHKEMIDWFILPISSISSSLFVVLFISHLFMHDYKFIHHGFVYVLVICSFCILSSYSNVSWFYNQYDLQNCCCKKNGECKCIQDSKCCCCCNKCICCICLKCCCCKQNNQCTCRSSDSSGICCTNTGTCQCCKEPCKCCSNEKCCECCKTCENCFCRCLKAINYDIKKNTFRFKFFECNSKNADHSFFSFYLGNNVGWFLFILYLALSKDKNVYHSFR